MTIQQLLKKLVEVSEFQAAVIIALHVERWPIGIVAQRHKVSVSRIQYEEAAGFRNMCAILLGGDGFDEAHADYLQRLDQKSNSDNKANKSKAAAAVGQKMKRGAGPSEV